ncbi:MAG: CDP-glycerol glycerophosphotransferase family protein, partial [Phycisphaerales bacterium]
AFAKAFKAKHFLESGYPRNDILFNGEANNLASLGTDNEAICRINQLKADGHKLVLYAPTFRDTTGDAISDGALDLDELSEFGQKHRIAFVFKFHYNGETACGLRQYDNIIWYNNSSDIYPLLRLFDTLVTDYSSIYMDYLLLDRPMIFFPYDYDKYTRDDRGLLFEYDWMTPGPKCRSQSELQKELLHWFIGQNDDFSQRRKELRKLAYKHEDGKASERLWRFIEETYVR